MISGKNTKTRDEAQLLERERISVYSPPVRMYFLLLAGYYAFTTVFHVTGETGIELLAYAGLSIVSLLVLLAGYFMLRSETSFLKLELVSAVANMIVLSNVLLIYAFEFDSGRLVYFLILIFIFAMTGATRRLTILSSAVAIACLYTIIMLNQPAMMGDYLYMGFASCFAAIGGNFMVRSIIAGALNSKLEAAARKVEADEAALQATQLSITDNLTGMPNRRAFFQTLETRADEYAANGETLAVFLIDLDSFKPVNDTYGHSIGDELLIAVGERLKSSAGDAAYLARIGGDEFAILMAVQAGDDVKEIGDAICGSMRAPFNLGRVIVHVGATVGIAERSDTDITPTKLVERADYALFHAKRTRKGSSAIFTDSDADIMTRLFIVDQALRGCDLEEELEVYYQPQYDMSSDTVKGFEALARWNNAELGQIDPTTFISVAETSGMITKITQTLLRKAMANIQTWPEGVTMAFNLSVHDILDISAMDEILSIVRESNVEASRICFEITETVMMGDIEKATIALQRLVDAGHEVALDDFGTGYSNFSYLHDLPIHKIKIDRSLIRNVAKNSKSTKMIATLLQFTRSLNKDCIVEGVETEAEFAAMRGLGARTVQGYYCGKPMTASDALDVLTSSASTERLQDDIAS